MQKLHVFVSFNMKSHYKHIKSHTCNDEVQKWMAENSHKHKMLKVCYDALPVSI